jgi:glycerophosphoryl diester phosphodiesterase
MRILAHRGASGYAPENTFAAFELAIEMGADAVETDLRMTRDGVLVLFHDEKVDRTTDGTGLLSDLSWEQLQQLDAGIKFNEKFRAQRVPALADFLDRIAARIPVCLEVKFAGIVDPLAETLAGRDLSRLEFTSFEWEVVERLRGLIPHARIGHLVRAFTAAEIEQARAVGLNGICPPARDVTPELVAAAHAAGLTVRAWGTKTPELLSRIAQAGVDGTTLDFPDWYRKP